MPMGKADIAVKNWLSDKERFADLFNGTVFGGKQVVLPENLEDMDRETDIIVTDKREKGRGVQRFRDIVKNGKKGSCWRFWLVRHRTRYIMPCQ